VAGAGGLRVRGVVHGSVNHEVAVGRPAADDRCCCDFQAFHGWGSGALCGKGAGVESGLRNHRRTSYAEGKAQ
jgi:hypothetical protein